MDDSELRGFNPETRGDHEAREEKMKGEEGGASQLSHLEKFCSQTLLWESLLIDSKQFCLHHDSSVFITTVLSSSRRHDLFIIQYNHLLCLYSEVFAFLNTPQNSTNSILPHGWVGEPCMANKTRRCGR